MQSVWYHKLSAWVQPCDERIWETPSKSFDKLRKSSKRSANKPRTSKSPSDISLNQPKSADNKPTEFEEDERYSPNFNRNPNSPNSWTSLKCLWPITVDRLKPRSVVWMKPVQQLSRQPNLILSNWIIQRTPALSRREARPETTQMNQGQTLKQSNKRPIVAL